MKEVEINEFIPGTWTYEGTNQAFTSSQAAIDHARGRNLTTRMGLSIEQQKREEKLGINSSSPRVKNPKTTNRHISKKESRAHYGYFER